MLFSKNAFLLSNALFFIPCNACFWPFLAVFTPPHMHYSLDFHGASAKFLVAAQLRISASQRLRAQISVGWEGCSRKLLRQDRVAKGWCQGPPPAVDRYEISASAHCNQAKSRRNLLKKGQRRADGPCALDKLPTGAVAMTQQLGQSMMNYRRSPFPLQLHSPTTRPLSVAMATGVVAAAAAGPPMMH